MTIVFQLGPASKKLFKELQRLFLSSAFMRQQSSIAAIIS
jgi:hypothetical protein